MSLDQRTSLAFDHSQNGSASFVHETMEVSPLDIAGFFLKLSQEEGITCMKLNKLLYLAHGYYWGNFDSPLITNGELAEAWKYGPVFRSVFDMFGGFKSYIIPPIYADISRKLDSFDESISDFLNQLWETFKYATPSHLVHILHQKDSPWYIVWHRKRGKYTFGSPIPDELTRAYYIGKARELSEVDGEE